MTTPAAEPRLAEYQMSSEEAKAFALENRWEPLTPAERGLMQLRQDRLCMPFSVFHEGIAALLGRSVWTHEYAKPDLLWDEYQGVTEKPDMAAIIGKLPEHLRHNMIIVDPGK